VQSKTEPYQLPSFSSFFCNQLAYPTPSPKRIYPVFVDCFKFFARKITSNQVFIVKFTLSLEKDIFFCPVNFPGTYLLN